jgi:hypothetical protein
MTADAQGQSSQKLATLLASDAIAVGGVTLWGYMVSFLYVQARALRLGIPEGFTHVSVDNVFSAIFFLVIAFLILIIFEMLTSLLEETLFKVCVFLAGIVLLAMAGIITEKFLSFRFFLVEGIPLLCLLYPIAFSRHLQPPSASFVQRYTTGVDLIFSGLSHALNNFWVSRQLGNAAGWIMMILFLSVAVARMAGLADAQFRVQYFVSVDDPSLVFLDRDGDLLLFRQVGSPNLTVKVIGKDQIPRLSSKRIGSMALEDF